jgi:hypothetical protein
MTVEYRVRSRRTRWTRKFKTLDEARVCAKTDWGFKDDATVYIERISVDIETV